LLLSDYSCDAAVILFFPASPYNSSDYVDGFTIRSPAHITEKAFLHLVGEKVKTSNILDCLFREKFKT
jgi:hypothetical protein